MENIKTLNIVREHLDLDRKSLDTLIVPTNIILDYLEDYEIGIPKEYIKDGIYGVKDWLRKENLALSFKGNTYEEEGQILDDFAFEQWESLDGEDVYVVMHFYLGNPYAKNYRGEKYMPIVLKFEAGTNFYQVLDNISLEEANIPNVLLNINNSSYVILPRIAYSSYFVFNIDTGYELYDMGIDIEEIKNKFNNKLKIRSRKL